MSTNGYVRIEEDGETIVGFYKHFDAYPSGLGLDMATFLKDIKITNGIHHKNEKIANGMGCLAAQLIAELKTEPGDLYIQKDEECSEYIYTISYSKNSINMKIVNYGDVIFNGTIKEFLELPKDRMDEM
jgi:hypothetical protein